MISAHDEESDYENQNRDIATNCEPPTKFEPPPILIGLEHVAQMRDRKRQLAALRERFGDRLDG